MVFILVTNTDWNEVPRIRHQIAYLLAQNGHRVIFFQRRRNLNYKFDHSSFAFRKNISIFSLPLRLHPKLRLPGFISLLSYLDSLYIYFFLFVRFRSLSHENFVFINFCQENFHLPSFFSASKHILFVHDHFPAQTSSYLFKKILSSQFQLSVKAYKQRSILTSSATLCDLVRSVTSPVSSDIFYPWSNSEHTLATTSSSSSSVSKNVILYWGVKNEFIDVDFLLELKSLMQSLVSLGASYQLWLVGPWVNNNIKSLAYKMGLFDGNIIKDFPQMSFADIPVDKVLCGLIPFKINGHLVTHLSTVELSNKAFCFVEHHIPMLVRGLPNFLSYDFFIKISTVEQFSTSISAIQLIDRNKMRHDCSEFMLANSSAARYSKIINICSSQLLA